MFPREIQNGGNQIKGDGNSLGWAKNYFKVQLADYDWYSLSRGRAVCIDMYWQLIDLSWAPGPACSSKINIGRPADRRGHCSNDRVTRPSSQLTHPIYIDQTSIHIDNRIELHIDLYRRNRLYRPSPSLWCLCDTWDRVLAHRSVSVCGVWVIPGTVSRLIDLSLSVVSGWYLGLCPAS